MPEATDWWLADLLDVVEVSVDDSVVDHKWLEVLELRLTLALLVLSAEEEDAFHDGLLNQLLLRLILVAERSSLLRCQSNAAARALGEWRRRMLWREFHPFKCLHVQAQHFSVEAVVLVLATIHEHAFFENGGAVVLAAPRRIPLCPDEFHLAFVNVILEKLIRALTQLALLVEAEAASERENFVLVND